MSSELGIPDNLADLPPGPELSAVLAAVNPARLHAVQLIEVVAARSRQIAYEQAELLVAVRELAYAPRAVREGPPTRGAKKCPYTSTEVAFALTATEYAAATLVAVSLSTVDRVPAVLEAMRNGRLDLDKAKILSTELEDATEEQARTVVAGLELDLEWCTTAQLRDKVRRLLMVVDPDAIRKRVKKALDSRFVEHHEYANGTSSISGAHLSKEKAAAANDYIDAIAKATKAAGSDDRHLDQIRADVFVDLLSGVDPGLSGAVLPAPRKGVVNLHLSLTTLARLDEYPGEIEGFGPVIADIARQTAAQMARVAQWRFTVNDDANETVAEGRIRPPRQVLEGQTATATGDAELASSGQNDGYRPTVAQRAFVLARDRTCRAPGCQRTARSCDIDHIRDWAYSRDTSILNLIPLCRRHHRAKHKGSFRVERTLAGINWMTPCGRSYTVIPDLAPPPPLLLLEVSQSLHGSDARDHVRR